MRSSTFPGDESSKIEAGGITLTGASDVLRADNAEGVRQVFIQYTGEFNSGNGTQLSIDGDALASSDIFNEGNATDVVAHGTWSGSVDVDTEGKQIYGDLQLTQIDLIDTDVGLILNASDADDSSLSALVTGSGNLTLAGNITIGRNQDQENTYSGTTTVTDGTVTLGKTNAFGATSLLTVSGGHVAFNGQTTQIGAIKTTQGGALTGSGAITLFGTSTQTDIVGANSDLSASIDMIGGHTATIHHSQGLGTGGIALSDSSTLILDYSDLNTAFANVLTGGGSLQIGNGTTAAAVYINGDNTGFSGNINIAANADLLASGANVDDNLGTGVIKFAGSSSTLHLSSNTRGDITIDNAFSGAGSLYVSGTDSNQHFGFETSGWGNDFNGGTLTLTGIAMRVGSTVNYGDNNAANLAQANLALNANAILEVSSGDRIDTFNNLTLSGGSVRFDGTAGFNAGNDLADLHIDGTLTLGSGNIALTLPDQSADMTGSLGHDSLLSTASSGLFETLIEAEKGIVGDISKITLNNGSGKGYSGKQNITGTLSGGSEGNVAYGLFDYGLATSGNSLGLDFKLTEVDIVRGETLVLKGDGTLGVVVKDYQTGTSGGNLEIASGSNVVLSGQNEYTGTTTVRGHLAADASGLGDTSLLVVESSGTYVNAGENTVGGLRVVEDGKLVLDGDGEGQYPTLAIAHDAGESSTIAGVIQGSGNLSLDEGTLAVTANAETNWQGNLALGTSATKAVLNLTGENALGNGTVTFVNNDSEIHLSHSGALAFGNAVSGSGSIYVDLAGNDFTFTNTQANLTAGSHLYLTDAGFSLDSGLNSTVAQKTEIVLGSQSTLSTSGEVDRLVWGLDLTSGGTIDLGEIDGDGGQLVLSSGGSGSGALKLSSDQTTTITFNGSEASGGNRVDESNNGASLLAGGGTFDLDLFEGVSDLIGVTEETDGQISGGLATDGDFSSTAENYYQNADSGDSADDLVAVLRRGGSGLFYYDANRDVVYMKYGIREIDLQLSNSGQGLRLDAESMTDATLSARVTGKGNIIFAGGAVTVTDSTNNYTGSTYVQSGATVTLGASNVFGKTDYLQINAGGSVALGAGFEQTVGELSGSGSLTLGSGSSFEIDNSQRKGEGVRDEDDPAAKDAFVINAAITGADAATFTINGAGASDGRADVSFGTTSNLSGTTLVLENLSTSFTSSGTNDHGYRTAASAADTVLGTDSILTIYANNAGTAQTYDLNELSFAGGRINFGEVTLTTDSTDAILHVDTLDLSQAGTIGVQATIDSGFNILDADTKSFRQTLIEYGSLTENSNPDNLQPASSEEMDDSAIYAADDTTVLANVQWSGGLVPKDDADPNTIAMSYQAVALKLAQGGSGDGLVLNADGHDSTLSIYVTDDESVKGNGGGNITYAGGKITVAHENDYTGVTQVTAGSVTLGANSGFGLTSDLQVSDGAYVDLGSHAQTAGAVHASGAHALRGSGTLTLGIAGNELNESFISGSNSAEGDISGFTGTVVLTNGHALVLDSTEGLGDKATANLASGTLVVSGASGTFATTLTGAGTMKIDGGTVAIAGAGNESFSGAWLLSNSAHTTVSGSADASAEDLLGTGVVNLDAGTMLTLSEQNSSTNWSIDNAFVGSGTLEVLGTNPSSLQNFAFSTDWDDSNVFEGTLSLESGIRFTVSSGSNNALNMAGADFKLSSGAELKVEKGGLVDTFKQLAVVDGSTIRFGGTLGIGAETRDLAKLQVNSLSGSGNIVIDLPADGQKVSQTIGEGDLIARDNSGFFQSLIVAETGGVNASGWLLNSNSGTASGLKQGILDANNIEVAQAEYSYGLEAGTDDGKNALGIGFDLTAVDISGGKTLTLSGEGDFDAVVKDSTGAGDLLISGNIGLTNAENEYSGMTTVSSTGKLTAGAGALGDTSGLTLQNGASYVNDGENTVGTLAAQGAQLTLNGALILEDGSGNSISGGSISGAGAFTLNAGNLEIDALESEKYSGAVTLGTTSGGAHLGFVNGTTGIGSGTVTFAHDESTVSVSGMNGVTLSNTYAGNGTINVDLGGSLNVFAFNGAQGKVEEDERFTGTLSLANAQYHLYEDETLANAGLRTNAGSLVVVNTSDKLDDRSVNVLTLGGGTIDFGSMSTDNAGSGQIATSSLNFVEGQHTTIDLALADRADADGTSVFGTGEKLYLIEGKSLGIDEDELGSLTLDSDAAATTQTVKQWGKDVANLHYGNGSLDADASGLYADWTLDTVELLSNASGGLHVEESGTITAVVSGSGDVTFTGEDAVVTIAGSGDNTYTGATFVTSDAQLTLGKDEALGDTNRLDVDSGASVAFGEYAQTIGELHVGASGHFTMSESGSLTLASGGSLIASANAEAAGNLIVSTGATLELRGNGAAGSLSLEAKDDASISFTQAGSADGYETVANVLLGSGTYIVGDGTKSAYVELTNSGNAFGALKVLNAGHFLVNGMESGANALGGADLTIASGAYAELNGSSGWTFDNVLDIDEGGELALSAGGSGNAFNFAETNQRIDGTVTLGTSDTDAHLTLEAAAGAQIGSGTIEFANADSSLTINTSGASVLGNLLSGVGQVTVSGTNGESFAFKDGQEKSVFTGALALTNVKYDFTTDANDILDDVSLTVNNGTTLVLNKDDDTATRKINGMSLNGGSIDFGTIGNGSGHIDLQGQSLSTSTVADTTFSLETDLADRQDASGSAAFDGVIDESVLLIGNVAADTPESVLDGLAFEDNGQAFTRDLTLVTEKGTETTARIHGKLGGLVLAGNADGTKNVVAGLENQSLELLTTYNVRDSGSIALEIFGSGSLAVYDELTLTSGSNRYTGDTTVSGTGAVLTLEADGALGQANSHTRVLSVTGGAKVDFGSTSQTIGSINAFGDNALESTGGTLTIANGGTVSGANSGFHTAVELSDGSAGLTLTNVDALGQASITTLGSNTDLVLSGADGEFDNIVAGSGGLSIVNGANVTLTGENTFAGALTVDSDSSVAASGDVFLHIVGGSLELEGSADFTQTTFADEHSVWKWNRTVNGSGNLSLSTDGAHELVLDSGLADFSGSLTLGNLEMTLSSGGSGMQSLTALSSSKIKSLILDTGADLHLEGATTLSTGVDNFGVTMKSGGSFVFEGIAVPGSEETATNTTHLTIDGNLTLESGFELSLSTEEDAKVDPTNGKSLLEQDDDGMSISVITADKIALDGFIDINKGGLVTLDGAPDTTFEIVDRDGNVVADGHYAFEIGLTDETDSDTLNLSYKLDQVSIRGGQELELAGGNDGFADENTLSAKLTGSGNLSITSGVVTLANSNNDFTGATTVQSEAVLYAESGALGSDSGAATSILTVAEKASAYIEGNNTVDGLMVSRGEGEETTGVLHIGASDDNVTLTLRSSTSETDPANHIYGTLSGAGTLRVLGNGQVDEGVDPDLTIHSSQERFDGDVQLESGAWVKIDADNSNLFGNRLVHTNISIDKGSLLTIESQYNGEGTFAGVFTNGVSGGGTVEIKLHNSSNLFRFTAEQDKAGFNGTFVLDQGTINYTQLYGSTSGGAGDVLADATLQLNDNGILQLFGDDDTGSGTTADVNLGGLTLDGGNIAFGSINYDAGHESAVSGAHAMHINLGGDGVLALNDDDGRTSTVTISQNETNNISAGGSELLAADDGTSIVLIHNIGSLEINGKNVTGEYANGASIGSDYLQLQNEAGETQLLAQQLGGSGDYVDVAEVVRTFDDELTFGQSTINGENGKYAVSLGYTVDRVGLLHQTGAVSADDFTDETVDNSLWQGLTITASDSEDPKRNEFSALITDGSNGEAGNLVLRGNETARDAVLTITGPENDAGEFTGNTYTGKTWVTAGANIALGANSAFGSTQALRVDSGSTVDFGIYDQTVGGLFALGDEALQSDEGSLITVKEDAVIRGSNTNLFGNITFEGDAEINNAVGLGTGTVTLAGNGSQLEISGASGAAGGEFVNTLVGGENTSVQMSGSDIVLGTDQLEKYEGSFNLVKSELDLSIKPAESDETVLGNVITTDVDSTLSASLGDGTKNFIFAEGSKIAGALAISNGAFNLSDERNLSALDKTDLVIGGAGRLEIASDIGAENVDNLTLNTGSIIAFSGGGTPGSAGYDDSKGHLDLGDGTLTVNGNVGVEVDVGMVNADLVEDAKHDVSNLPLTAQDVLTADQGGQILANLVEAGNVVNDEGSFTLTVTGGEYDSGHSSLKVGIFNDGNTDEVAKGIYDYTVRLTEGGLNLSYGLTGVELIRDKTLSLKGYAETDDIDNTLSIAVTGDGSLSIDAGTITLTGQNGYKGSTTVAGGATLVTGIGGKALGETSSLNLKDTADGLVGARVEIHGDETVGALNIDAKSTLALGAAAENDRTEFTIKNTAGVKSTVHGQIKGGRDSLITVIGNADSNDHDLVVTSANNNFYGDVTLQDAYVRLESINSFGSEGILRLDTTSTLEINSNADDAQTVTDDDGTIYTYHKFENLISGDGTVRVALDDADDYFDFAEDQYKYPSGDDQAFTGTLELADGKFRFTDRKADVLESVHVKLDGDATLDVSADTSETTDRTMRGLTLAGGTLEFGSLALDREQAEARATHIDLNGYDLTLEDSDRQVEVSFRQDATNYISDAGSEVVNAADGDGSKIVLIHDIGKLVVDGQAIATAEDAQAVLQDYLKHEFADNAEDQILHQSIAGAGQEADVQQVARVNREFGDFGYADMSAQNLGNALYVGYEINSIELLYRGSNNEAYGADGVWKGLTVSTSDLSNQLKAQLTGQGNLVVTGGTGGTLLIGDASTETEYNNYTGRTWVTGNAKVEFAEDNAFGNTSHLRVDVGSSVNLGGDASGGGFSQTVGSLVTYDENALIGGKDASVTVTGSAQIAGNNSGFYGNLIFDTEQVTTGTVTDVEGLGKGDVYIGENYQLQITDVADASGGSVLLENDLLDVNGEGGLLQIGSGLSKPEHESTTIIAGNNLNFSGNIRVEDGWAISAEVGEGEDIADRLGTGSLTLAGDASATIDFGSSDVEWNHNVDGRGTLNVTTDADRTVSIGIGLGSDFEGTFTVGGGRFELAENADKLGNGNLAASGGNASIIVSGEESVEFGKNLTITGSNEDRGQLVFEDPIKLSDNGSPELIVDGNLTLKGADVSVSVDGELEAGQGPSDALDMSSITMADEGAIDYVIAKAGLIDMSDTTLSLETGGSGNAMTVDITDGGKKVATGKYDFGLSVSTDRTELGLSYKLVEVEIDDADTLLGLQGAISGSTSAADWANASEFSANITGAGGISLVNGNLTLTGAGNTYHGATVVYDGAVLTVESSLGNTSLVTVAEGGRLVNASDSTKAGAVNVAGRLDLQAGSKLSLKEGGESSITGSITGSGNLALLSNASVVVTAGSGYEAFTGSVTMEEGAEYALSASNGSTVIVRNNFADSKNSAGGTVRFDKASGSSSANYSLAGSAVGFTGTFELGDNVVVSANSIEAIGGKGSELLITTGKVGDEIDKATLSFEYDDELVGQNDSLRITQGMTEGITFEKSGDGVVDLSDNAMGAGKVDVKEGGVLFGTSDRKSAYDTALEIAEDAWAAGFGGVSSLKVDLGGSFYVGGRSGYNSVFASTATKAANEDPANTPPAADNTVDFVVNGSVTNAGTIYVGNKNADGSAPADSSSIGNELVIKGDYNVTASDKDGVGTGGIFDMNAIIAGDDSIADHVTITGKINGNGYVDVNYDSTVSTGGTLEYLGLVKVEGGDDGESLWLKDEVKIGDLWYRLMWSSEQNEYYLQSSVTDPGDKPWDTEDVENVNAGTRSALAFMQAQAFDLSLRGHLGETLYVDPVTGEQRKSSFWMVQRGDWTKFSNASGQLDADGNLYTTHLGTDLFKRETDGATFRWGVLAGFADGDFDVSSNVDGKSSKGSFRGYSAGLYMTAESKAESGPFLGLQLRWNRFDSEVGQDDYDVNGLSLTAEASWDQLLSKGITDGGRNYEWRLEPHVRAYWTNFGDPDDWTSSLGETYSSDFDNGLLVRVGARTKIQTTLGTGPAWQAYAEANWVYNNGDYSTTMSTKYGDVTSTQNGAEFAEFRLGLEAQFTTNVNVWLEGHHQTGSDDYESTGAMFGFKYMW